MAIGASSSLIGAVAPSSSDPGVYYDYASLGSTDLELSAHNLVPVLSLVKNGDVGQNTNLITQVSGEYNLGVKLGDGTTLSTSPTSEASGETPANIQIVPGTGIALYLRMVTPFNESNNTASTSPYKDVHADTPGSYTWTKVWEDGSVINGENNIQRFRGSTAGKYDFYYYIDAGSSVYEDVGTAS